jgi:hypothetical protein
VTFAADATMFAAHGYSSVTATRYSSVPADPDPATGFATATRVPSGPWFFC